MKPRSDGEKSMPTTKDEVVRHYAAIASAYYGKSNQLCELYFKDLLKAHIDPGTHVLEVGGGGSALLEELDVDQGVVLDISQPMLQTRRRPTHITAIVGDAENLPFEDQIFDAVFSINLLEHVISPEKMLAESVRVLKPGGTWIGVTPNGGWSFLLQLAELLGMKLPEGPHRFLKVEEFRNLAFQYLTVVTHETCLTLPFVSLDFARKADKVGKWLGNYFGFFQYLIATK